MWLDLRLVCYPFNDFTLLGRPFSNNCRRWMSVGAVLHGVNGAAAGLVYARLYPYLWGPGWLRGLCFALTENTLLWPVMLLVDRAHPGRRDGSLGAAWTWPSFGVATMRHVAFGLIVGLLDRPDVGRERFGAVHRRDRHV